MSLEAVKCPQCGANVEVQANTATFFCTYCGTRLQASRSSMGILSASILSSIKEDTNIMAKKAALVHLKEQLELYIAQRQKLVQVQEKEYDRKVFDIYIEACALARSGQFRDPENSQYFIDRKTALKKHMLEPIVELDTKIGEIRLRITTLESVVNDLVLHV